MRPLSPARFILEMMASRFGSLRVGGFSKGRSSATGMPDFKMMYDSPSATARMRALVCKWSSRTLVLFMCHSVTQFLDRCNRHQFAGAVGGAGADAAGVVTGGDDFPVHSPSHSRNVLYHSRVFCGFRTQCPSSGKTSSLDGTFCSCKAV